MKNKLFKTIIFISVLFAAGSFVYAKNMRVCSGAGFNWNMIDYHYDDDKEEIQDSFSPTFYVPTFYYQIPTGTFVEPVVGMGFFTVAILSDFKICAGVSFKLPEFGFFYHDLMLLGAYDCIVESFFVTRSSYRLSMEMPFTWSLKKDGGFSWGLNPVFSFSQEGNYDHGHKYKLGLNAFVGYRF